MCEFRRVTGKEGPAAETELLSHSPVAREATVAARRAPVRLSVRRRPSSAAISRRACPFRYRSHCTVAHPSDRTLALDLSCCHSEMGPKGSCVGGVSPNVVHGFKIEPAMITSFRDEWLRTFFVEDARSPGIPSDLEGRLFRKLQMIDDATTDQDLRMPTEPTSRSCAVTWRASTRPRQRSVAAAVPLGRQSRRGRGSLSRQPQL